MKYVHKIRSLFSRAAEHLDSSRRQLNRDFLQLRETFYSGFWTEAASEIGAEIEDIGHGFFLISRGGRQTHVRTDRVPLDDSLSIEMALNKPLTYKIIAGQGAPVPRHFEYRLSEMSSAADFLTQLGSRSVVKPAFGTGGGKGVTTRVASTSQLRKASFKAARFQSTLLVEEEMEGASYRLLFLNGELLDAIRRDPPTLVGNGISDIRALIAAENEERLNGPAKALSPLQIDLESKQSLAEQKLTLRSVPQKGQRIRVKNVVNENSSKENHVVRAQVHPSIVELCRRIVHERFELVGVDLLSRDISVPLEESGGVVSEINATPGLHHHVLVANVENRVAVGPLILDYLMSHRSFTSLDLGGDTK